MVCMKMWIAVALELVVICVWVREDWIGTSSWLPRTWKGGCQQSKIDFLTLHCSSFPVPHREPREDMNQSQILGYFSLNSQHAMEGSCLET